MEKVQKVLAAIAVIIILVILGYLLYGEISEKENLRKERADELAFYEFEKRIYNQKGEKYNKAETDDEIIINDTLLEYRKKKNSNFPYYVRLVAPSIAKGEISNENDIQIFDDYSILTRNISVERENLEKQKSEISLLENAKSDLEKAEMDENQKIEEISVIDSKLQTNYDEKEKIEGDISEIEKNIKKREEDIENYSISIIAKLSKEEKYTKYVKTQIVNNDSNEMLVELCRKYDNGTEDGLINPYEKISITFDKVRGTPILIESIEYYYDKDLKLNIYDAKKSLMEYLDVDSNYIDEKYYLGRNSIMAKGQNPENGVQRAYTYISKEDQDMRYYISAKDGAILHVTK